MRLISYLGYLAGVLTVVSLWPQTKRVWRTKQVQDLSSKTFALLVTAGLLWVTYGILSTDWPVIATNVGMVSLNAAILVAKLLASAVANAENNDGIDPEELYVSACYADEGPTLKRFRPRAMGRATRIRKRTSHLTITLTPKEL